MSVNHTQLTVSLSANKVLYIFLVNVVGSLICMSKISLDNLSFIHVEFFVIIVIELLIAIGFQQVFLDVGSKAKRTTACFLDNQKIANLDTMFVVYGPFVEIEGNWGTISKGLIISNRLRIRNARPNWNTKLSFQTWLLLDTIS